MGMSKSSLQSVLLIFAILFASHLSFAQNYLNADKAHRRFSNGDKQVKEILKDLDEWYLKDQQKGARDRGDGIAAFLDDEKHENSSVKSSSETDLYHSCLLSEHKKESDQKRAYNEQFRAYISYANSAFGVPMTLLTCTCGRESRFDGDAKNPGGATGVCQATNGFIEEINGFINKNPRIREEWQKYIDSISSRIESPECLKPPITKALILKCPALGIGAASIYMQHIFQRIEGSKEKLSEAAWNKNSLDIYTVVAGTYNLGVTFADKNLKEIHTRKEWSKILLKRTCEGWMVNSKDAKVRQKQIGRAEDKFDELKGHMVSIRNCLEKNNYLNHQNKAMGGACTNPERAKQSLASNKRYKDSLPQRCDSGRVYQMATPSGSEGVD